MLIGHIVLITEWMHFAKITNALCKLPIKNWFVSETVEQCVNVHTPILDVIKICVIKKNLLSDRMHLRELPNANIYFKK